MAKTRYAPDRGLTARMTLTMFLLGLVFVAFITVLVLVLSATGRVSGGAIIFFAVLLGLGLGVGSLFYSDKIALSTSGAQQLKSVTRQRQGRGRAGRVHSGLAGRDRAGRAHSAQLSRTERLRRAGRCAGIRRPRQVPK